MEHVSLSLSGENYDKAVHGGLDALPVLPECGDLAIYVKPDATEGGKAGAVVTFTVKLPDGKYARVQAVTTAALLELAGAAVRGWRDSGQIK